MNTLFQAGARVRHVFERHAWAFCFICGVANFRWGTPRLTNDSHKAFAARPQDWVDIEGVIIKQRGHLRWGQIWGDLRVLADLKEAPELLDTSDGIATRAESVVGAFPHARS